MSSQPTRSHQGDDASLNQVQMERWARTIVREVKMEDDRNAGRVKVRRQGCSASRGPGKLRSLGAGSAQWSEANNPGKSVQEVEMSLVGEEQERGNFEGGW